MLAVASLFIGVGAAHAESGFYLRLAPEVGRITVEHTKKVTIQGGSSSSTSSTSGLALAGALSGGVRLNLPGNWLVGGELVGVLSSRRKLNGTISPTTSGNIYDVWPGRWDFSDLSEVGGNFLFGRALGIGRSQVYLFSGMNRAWTEFASGGTNPVIGVAGEDRQRLGRWPWTIGAGTTLRLKWAGGLPSPLLPLAHRLDNRLRGVATRLQVQRARGVLLSRSSLLRLTTSR